MEFGEPSITCAWTSNSKPSANDAASKRQHRIRDDDTGRPCSCSWSAAPPLSLEARVVPYRRVSNEGAKHRIGPCETLPTVAKNDDLPSDDIGVERFWARPACHDLAIGLAVTRT